MAQGTVDDRMKGLLKVVPGFRVEIRATVDDEGKMLVWAALVPENGMDMASVATHPHRRSAAALLELEGLVEARRAERKR